MPTYALACALVVLTGCMANDLGNLESAQSGTVPHPIEKTPFDDDFRAACGDGGVTSAGDAAFTRWPYLQKMTEHSVDIMWTTPPEAPAADLVVTTPQGEIVATLTAQEDTQADRPSHTQYVASIAGLEPGTMYCYNIQGDAPWLSPTGFRTAPAATSDAPIRIAVMGDLGVQSLDQYAIVDQLKQTRFDLLLAVGDIAYQKGSIGDFEDNFFYMYRDLMLSVPFFVISGNHDYSNDGATFRELFSLPDNGIPSASERWYSFDWGSAHLVGIDTEKLTQEQSDWVRADLSATEKAWKIAFMHRPAYSSGAHGSSMAVRKLFGQSFQDLDVRLVLAGHDHNYERAKLQSGVTYVVSGSAGIGTRPVGTSAFTAYAESVTHFTLIDIAPAAMRLTAIDAVGGGFDQVSIER